MVGSDPPAEGGMGVHMPTLPDADRGIQQGGVAPATAAPSGTASPLRRPWCNRNAASDMRNRWRAHGSGVFVYMHADVDVHARHATDPRRSVVKIRPRKPVRAPCREPVDRRSGPRGPEQVLQLDDPLEAALQPAMLLDHRVVHAADRLLDPVDLAAGRTGTARRGGTAVEVFDSAAAGGMDGGVRGMEPASPGGP